MMKILVNTNLWLLRFYKYIKNINKYFDKKNGKLLKIY